MSTVSRNLKKLRKERNMTQDELAEKISVTRQTISNWETGKSQPDLELLVLLGEKLGTDAHELIYGNRKNEYVRFQKKKIFLTVLFLLLAVIEGVLELTIVPSMRDAFQYYFRYYGALIAFAFIFRPLAFFDIGCFIMSFNTLFFNLTLQKKTKRIIVLVSLGLIAIPSYTIVSAAIWLLFNAGPPNPLISGLSFADVSGLDLILLFVFPLLGGAGLFIGTRRNSK